MGECCVMCVCKCLCSVLYLGACGTVLCAFYKTTLLLLYYGTGGMGIEILCVLILSGNKKHRDIIM